LISGSCNLLNKNDLTSRITNKSNELLEQWKIVLKTKRKENFVSFYKSINEMGYFSDEAQENDKLINKLTNEFNKSCLTDKIARLSNGLLIIMILKKVAIHFKKQILTFIFFSHFKTCK
jgi:hypothetical protein